MPAGLVNVRKNFLALSRLVGTARNRPVRTRMRGGVVRAGESPALTRLAAIVDFHHELCVCVKIQLCVYYLALFTAIVSRSVFHSAYNWQLFVNKKRQKFQNLVHQLSPKFLSRIPHLIGSAPRGRIAGRSNLPLCLHLYGERSRGG